jgi:hypothetical protein
LAPCLIDLESSGLQCSPRIAALNGAIDVLAIVAYSCSTMPSSSRQTMRTRPRRSFLSVFNCVGFLWTLATTNSHSDDEQFSFMAQSQTTLINQMAYLMTQSKKSVIKFMLAQYQTNPLLICKCYGKRISNNFLKQLKLNSMTAKLANTGILWSTKSYHP